MQNYGSSRLVQSAEKSHKTNNNEQVPKIYLNS